MKYFLSHHKKWLKSGRVPNGLCCTIGHKILFKIMCPTVLDDIQITMDGESMSYWGSGLKRYDINKCFEYTTLRQNIVLFCAAMNNEL